MKTGYPDLDVFSDQVAVLRARTDVRSREWRQEAEAVGQAGDRIAAKRDEMVAWISEAEAQVASDPDHPRYAELLKALVMTRQKLKTYRQVLDEAAPVIVGMAEPVPEPEPEQMELTRQPESRTPLTDRVRQRRKTAA